MGNAGTSVIINQILLPTTKTVEFSSPVIQSIIAIELFFVILMNENCNNGSQTDAP